MRGSRAASTIVVVGGGSCMHGGPGIVGRTHRVRREETIAIWRSCSIWVLRHLRVLMLQSVMLRHGRRRAVAAIVHGSGEKGLSGVPSMITDGTSAGVGGSATTCALGRLDDSRALGVVCWLAVRRSAGHGWRLRVVRDLIVVVLWIGVHVDGRVARGFQLGACRTIGTFAFTFTFTNTFLLAFGAAARTGGRRALGTTLDGAFLRVRPAFSGWF